MLKRVFDIIAASALLIALLPLLLAISVLIRMDSAGDIVFRQVRIEWGCRPFRILKFRTMVANAERMGGSEPRQRMRA